MVYKSLLATALCSTLVACNDATTQPNIEVVTDDNALFSVDASSYTAWVHVDLKAQKIVTQQHNWHIALQRYNVITNDAVTASIGEKQSDWYDQNGEPIVSAFISGTAATEAQDLAKHYSSSELTTVTNVFTPAINNDWVVYDTTSHELSANPDAVWFVAHSDGNKKSKFWVSDIDAAHSTMTINVQHISNNSLDTVQTLVVNYSDKRCVDFDALTTVDCTDPAWDYSITHDGDSFISLTNGGAYGPLTMADADVMPLAGLTHAMQADLKRGLFDLYPAFEYGVNGDHLMYPNFRTYVIADETFSVNIQLQDYYNAAGKSGTVSIAIKPN